MDAERRKIITAVFSPTSLLRLKSRTVTSSRLILTPSANCVELIRHLGTKILLDPGFPQVLRPAERGALIDGVLDVQSRSSLD